MTVSELGQILNTMAEQAEKRQHFQDKNLEKTKRLKNEQIIKQLCSKQNHEMML